MARSKSNKISFKNAKITEQDGNFIIKIKADDDTEVTENLNKRLKEFINIDGININVKKAGKPVNRTPSYKYKCGCGNEIKSKSDSLHVKCLDCEEEFIKEE